MQNNTRPRQNRGFNKFNRSNKFGSNKGGRKYGNRGGAGQSFKHNTRRNPYRDSYIPEEMYVSKANEHKQESVYSSEMTFGDIALHNTLRANIASRKYAQPTHIQAQAIQPILEGKDILGMASTGSGKTAAFLIPLINLILSKPAKRCLIVAPTRELVNQIQAEYRTFSQNTFLRDVLIVGGASYSTQIRVLKKLPQFVIATPGRLIDLSNEGHIDLSSFEIVVLDEVDQMLDMGFIHDVKLIISKLKSPRQSMFFSATLSAKTREIAASLLSNPVVIEVAKQSAAKNVEQSIVRVGGSKSKLEVLHDLLINTNFQKVLVFSRTKHGADDIARALRQKGHKTDALHGNKSLNARTKILAMFRRNEIDVLVATDVASRGIDVPDISHVINYDKPATYEDYIHRIGRTGRIGKKGNAVTFV